MDATREEHLNPSEETHKLSIAVSETCYDEIERALYFTGARNYLFGDKDSATIMDLGNVVLYVGSN